MTTRRTVIMYNSTNNECANRVKNTIKTKSLIDVKEDQRWKGTNKNSTIKKHKKMANFKLNTSVISINKWTKILDTILYILFIRYKIKIYKQKFQWSVWKQLAFKIHQNKNGLAIPEKNMIRKSVSRIMIINHSGVNLSGKGMHFKSLWFPK